MFATEKKEKKRGGGCNTLLKTSTQKEQSKSKINFLMGYLKQFIYLNFFNFIGLTLAMEISLKEIYYFNLHVNKLI